MLVANQDIAFQSLPEITVFPDSESDTAFYAISAKPRLARDEAGASQISLMVYGKKRDGVFQPTGGFLSLTVSLGIRPDEESALKAELKQYIAAVSPPEGPHSPPPPPPELRGIPWITATVSLSLGTKISASGQPSMFGDNRCSFSIKLDAEQSKSILKLWKDQLQDSKIRYQASVKAGPPSQSQMEFSASHTEVHDNDRFSIHSRIDITANATEAQPLTILFEGPVDLSPEDAESRINQVEM